MKGQIINDEIVASGNVLSGANVYDIPDDYTPERYIYSPAVSGVFDPNGFVLRQVVDSINFTKRQSNIQAMNNYMASFIGNGITELQYDQFTTDTSPHIASYLNGGGARLFTWIETVNRNGYNATTVGFKTKTAYRGALVGDVYPRAEQILIYLNDL